MDIWEWLWVYSGKAGQDVRDGTILDGWHILDGGRLGRVRLHYRRGFCHREDGPAVIFEDGSKMWCLDGKDVRMEAVLDTPEKREAYLLEESLRRL